MVCVSGYARTAETESQEHENSPGSPKDEEGAGKTPQQTLAEQVIPINKRTHLSHVKLYRMLYYFVITQDVASRSRLLSLV